MTYAPRKLRCRDRKSCRTPCEQSDTLPTWHDWNVCLRAMRQGCRDRCRDHRFCFDNRGALCATSPASCDPNLPPEAPEPDPKLGGAVYVDALQVWPHAWGPFLQGSCHMFARLADLPALHALAKSIGVSRSWYQDKRDGGHYDLTPSKRALAIKAGALELDRAETVRVLRDNRSLLSEYLHLPPTTHR